MFPPPNDALGDVFVSYAHVDDNCLPDAKHGWVTTLVEYLRALLVEKLGRKENLRLWTDHRLSGNGALTDTILSQVRNSRTILIVLSKGYLESPWCGREMRTFLEAARDRGSPGTRIFIVEKDEVEQKPRELEDFRGYRFWIKEELDGIPRTLGFPRPNPDREPDYYRHLQDLSYHLAREISKQREPGKELPVSLPEPAHDAPAVYLAEVTDDLDADNAELSSYLSQAGLRVVPKTLYPRDPAAFKAAAQADLAGVKLFVQLLSAATGKRPAELPEGYVGLQHQLAVQRGVPIRQWRHASLDLSLVSSPTHRALLEGLSVSNEGLEEFKKRIVREATAPPPAPSPRKDIDRFVFVNVQRPDDEDLEKQICLILDHEEIGYGMPLESDRPADVREHFRVNLLHCDAVMLVYGHSRPSWVVGQLHESRKVLSERSPWPVIGLLEGPPEPKPDLKMRLPHLRLLNCRTGLNEAELKRFLDGLERNDGP
jgi:hypothetical protein